MKVLVCGGAKTKNIVIGLEKKFGHVGIEFLVVNDIDSIEEIYGKGEYFDRALICEQGVTKDGLYRNEEERIRGSICNFAVSASMHNMAGANYVFLTADMEMAEIMHEELLPLRNDSVVVVKASPYSIGFFSSLIATDLDKLDSNIVFKPVTEEDVEGLDIFDNNVKETKEKHDEKDSYTFANDNESLEDFALSNIEDNESDGMMLDGDEYRDIQPEKKDDKEVEEVKTEEEEVEAEEEDEPEEELEVEVDEEESLEAETDNDTIGEVPSYKNVSIPVKFDEESLNEEDTDEPEIELEVDEDDSDDEEEELEVELDEDDEDDETEEENNETGELTDYSIEKDASEDDELEVEEDEELEVEADDTDEDEELEVEEDNNDADELEVEVEAELEEEASEDDDIAGEVPDSHTEKFIENDFEAFGLEEENGLSEDEPVDDSLDELEVEEDDNSDDEDELEVEEDDTDELEEDTLDKNNNSSDDLEADDDTPDDELEEFGAEDETEDEEVELNEEEEENFVNKEKGHRNMKKEDESFNNYNNEEAAHREGKGFAEVDKENFKKTLDLFANRGTMFLVTGTHGSGATTVGFNLANTLSRLGYKTLVIDCDSEIKSMSFASKEVYESMEPSASCLREAINGNNISDFVTVVRPNFHVLCDGIASDTYQFDREIHKDRFTNFAIKLKQNYQFVVFAMSSKLAVDYCEDITYMCDDIIYTIDANKYGITKALLDLCNIDSDAMQRQMFQKSSILYNQMDRLNDLYGYKVRNPKDIAICMDKYLYDLVGEAADDLKFSKMKLLGYIPDIDNYMSQGLFSGKCWSDTEPGRRTYIGILKSILFRK